MSDQDSKAGSRAAGSEQDIEEEQEPAYIPKNPIIRPEDVKISAIMAQLMQGDLSQVKLHRTLGSAADIDNEHTVAEHI